MDIIYEATEIAPQLDAVLAEAFALGPIKLDHPQYEATLISQGQYEALLKAAGISVDELETDAARSIRTQGTIPLSEVDL